MERGTNKQDLLFPTRPILLVDDEPQALQSFETVLRASGINNLLQVQDSRDVLSLLGRQSVEMMILDLWMPHRSGEELLPVIVQDHPGVPVVVVTGVNEVETAVRCMKAGAFDYLVKPVEKSRLASVVARAIEIQALRLENERLQRRVLGTDLEHAEAFSDIVTQNEKMLSIFHYVEAIARTLASVLITGETGVGKELVARAIHVASGLPGPFVPVNAAGLDDAVFSDTLFGHRKGAFTGADQARGGLVEQAAGGTLFLDEIGDLGAQSQVKLLRLLQEREFFPVGSDVPKRSTARVIAATNRNLDELRRSGGFRRDLYYRLNTHHVHVPALRERRDDLPLLVEHFLDESARQADVTKPSVPSELYALLDAHDFPGNVRELRSMILDAVSLSRSRRISLERFEKAAFGERSAGSLVEESASDPPITFSGRLPTLKEAEHRVVEEAMKRACGNQSVAARMLGISRQALNRRILQKKT